MYKDGAGASYDAVTTNLFTTVPFGQVLVNPLDPKAGTQANPSGLYFEMFNFGSTAGFAQKVDNSVAGEMRDCGECHVGGGMMEYVVDSGKTTSGSYDPAVRTSLRDYVFGGAITAFNALVDIFNPDTSKRGDVVVQDYSQTGVLEMDCLVCHMKDYSWEGRKEAVRRGEFDASRAAGARLTTSIVNGTAVFYNNTSVTANESGQLVVDLSLKLQAAPDSANCASCHLSQYNVDWKKRGEQWLPTTDVHMGIGCMGCHERSDKAAPTVGTEGVINNKLGLCDPAKGGSSAFDALWNKLDSVNFKNCAGCHEPAASPNYDTFGAPISRDAHTAAGLTAKIAYDKDGRSVSHMDLIDCTACHIKKTFDGGAFVDGTGADAEGRVALHDEPQVARDMTNGNALYWDNGKLYAANLLTSFFIRDMNGMDDANYGLDANNDGRNAGMDPLLQTHVNDINIAKGLKAVTMEQNADGSWVNEAEILAHFNALKGDGKGTATTDATTPVQGGIKQLLGISDPNNDKKFLPKLSFLMVPFKASHNIVPSVQAWGKNGCSDCHGENKGFYNGAYPINGNMDGYDNSGSNFKFRFKSNQVTPFTKVNGLADVTDSHPNVVTKKGDRSVPVPILPKFDTPYTPDASAVANQALRNIDRSEVIYEQTFQVRDTAWQTTITGSAPAAACSGATSPFYCADPDGAMAASGGTMTSNPKALATSTKGWLLKIEVRPAGDSDPAHITFRTAQLGKDNATSMTEALGALPASFKSNTDFTVTESGGALTITAAAGKEIRISPLTDAGPFGLKGKLWKNDPIVRGANSYATRNEYVAYLNGLSNKEQFGIGIDPKAAINPVADYDAARLGTQVLQGNLNLAAPPAQFIDANGNGRYDAGETVVGTSTYTWTYTDGTKDANGNYIVYPIGAGQNVTASFATTGTKNITLTVADEEGKSGAATTSFEVVAPGISVSPATVSVSTSTAFTFASLPSPNTQLKITWGDGMTQNMTVSNVTSKTVSHTYASKGTKTLSINVYNLVNNVSTLVGSKTISVTVQ